MTNAHIRVYIGSIYIYAVTYTHAPIYIYTYIGYLAQVIL